ncbi:uncharacterized protein EV420DRAFT_1520494 [Desarmillaria tabescens]|uniref:Uncharacterized protein n=1 Tax=Armillaria tabescens TaxID=1929756 RepID=A0AA39TZI5_ARMTA|nr:uncharacterized protein EV420DRAFT_1520494 [Desarmillaria tabescens]KAK0463875.1 hypothetical protein EV420DRAFT_1520494 [Desarmillaria tabescens]
MLHLHYGNPESNWVVSLLLSQVSHGALPFSSNTTPISVRWCPILVSAFASYSRWISVPEYCLTRLLRGKNDNTRRHMH